MLRRFSLLVVLFAAFATPATAQLRLHGSNTVGEQLAPALVRAWLAENGFDRIETVEDAPLERTITGTNAAGDTRWVEIHAHGSSTSFRDLDAGLADIGMSSRRIRDSEVARLQPLGRLDRPSNEFVVGIDGLAVIVHPDNPIAALSIEQIRDAFSGRVENWRTFGGPDRRITRYARDENSGTWDSFESMVLQDTALAAGSARFESSSALSDRVASDPGAIGFIGLPYIDRARALAVSAGGEAVPPERFSSATEDYPLSRRLYIYVPDRELDGLGGDLARFAVRAEGQEIVDEIGFVGQEIQLQRVAIPASAPRTYREFVDGALRASLNFRFEAGRPVLDSKSERDLDRLIDFLGSERGRDMNVMLMGFADPSETLRYFSVTLSMERADYVAALLARAGIPVRRTRGFGDALTLAEGTGSSSAAKNRRVEVWLIADRAGAAGSR
ncbi:OmpA family protein [Wenzhouxiangella sp. XN79A]|uniref:substrate-binding domain-containing protein n=1 Tax=Wenzhouxiangella sp. XN79A TaxID=2724193 RepID=UPI00144A85E1|nr:substrate-binding domain-containing protein [Wenzhouxiangella sp. XN79A]NKI34294.1 OmpA family protein [Wenzhouxiangella sp. XN79A]